MTNWKNAEPDALKEIAREAETYLRGQLMLATSADQRASVLAGIYTAAGTAIIAGMMVAHVSVAFVAGGLVAAAMFLIGAALCIKTALPADFYLAGNEPDSWEDDVDEKKPISESYIDVVKNSQECIASNRATLERNAKLFTRGARFGVYAPIGGIVMGLIVWFFMTAHFPGIGK